MARNRIEHDSGSAGIRFTLVGLTLFSVSLVVTGALLTSGLMSIRARIAPGADETSAAAAQRPGPAPQEVPAWGELITRDIEIERPEEYVAAELEGIDVPTWIFEQQSPEQAKSLLLACGLSPAQADQALSPGLVLATASNTIVRPSEDLVLSLSPQVRAKVYGELGRFDANHYMRFPFCFQGDSFEEALAGSSLELPVIEKVRKLLYPRGTAQCFSDFEVVMRGLPSDRERLHLLKALSRQRALLVKLHIRPDTDIEKLLGYWDRGIQVKDARPLLESVKRLEGGGNLSLLYLLPRFARDRLYTYPQPPGPNEPAVDCHWSTMNFFNETPDNRFANPAFTVQYIKTNFYPVAVPSLYGDLVLVLNGDGNAVHSAVHIAEDIVFTKNGNNYSQPWMLMRLEDLLADYASDPAIHLAYYRNKNR